MTRDRLLALLKDIEFSVPTTDPRGTFTRDLDECPECGGAGNHYHPDPNAVCELKAAIDWLEDESNSRRLHLTCAFILPCK